MNNECVTFTSRYGEPVEKAYIDAVQQVRNQQENFEEGPGTSPPIFVKRFQSIDYSACVVSPFACIERPSPA